MDFMIPYGVLFVFCQILAEIRAKLFLEKPITYHPADTLRCLPMESNFLLEIPPESGSARLGNSLSSLTIYLAELSQLDRSSPAAR